MKSLAFVSLLVVSSLWVAGPARAGTFFPPFSDVSVCGDETVAAHMADPNSLVNATRCDALCKKAAGACKKFVNRIVACKIQHFVTATAFFVESCKEEATPELVASCKVGIKQDLADIEDVLKGQRDTQLLQCEVWGVDCQVACP